MLRTDTQIDRLTTAIQSKSWQEVDHILNTITTSRELNQFGTHQKTPLAWAAYHGDTKTFHQLLRKGVDINLAKKNEDTPLISAIRTRQWDLVNLLLSKQADVHHMGYRGMSALSWAAHYGDLNIVNKILATNPVIDVVDADGNTPLIEAVKLGYWQVAKALLEHGANMDHVGHNRMTAFLWANSRVEEGDLKTLSVLIKVIEKAIQCSISQQQDRSAHSQEGEISNIVRQYLFFKPADKVQENKQSEVVEQTTPRLG